MCIYVDPIYFDTDPDPRIRFVNYQLFVLNCFFRKNNAQKKLFAPDPGGQNETDLDP